MPVRSFITNGPYCATGSSIGRPCNINTCAPEPPARTLTGASARTTAAVGDVIGVEAIAVAPSYTYNVRTLRSLAALGTVTVASGPTSRCQIATSASARAAHESGGGAGG